MKNFRHDSK